MTRGPIESEIQILVEGNDQRNFFEAFISHLGRVISSQEFLVGFPARIWYPSLVGKSEEV